MYGNGLFGMNGANPILFNQSGLDNNNTKLNHDSYEVYVDRDYVGKKVLITQNEKIEDVEGYLKGQGFRSFTTQVEGDHLNIITEDEDRERMKDNLDIYLNIR